MLSDRYKGELNPLSGSDPSNFAYQPVMTGDYDDEEKQENCKDNDLFGDEVPVKEKIMQRQNEVLESLGSRIENLSQVSLQIANEIEEQNHVINHLEGESQKMQVESSELEHHTRRVNRTLWEENYRFCWFFIVI